MNTYRIERATRFGRVAGLESRAGIIPLLSNAADKLELGF